MIKEVWPLSTISFIHLSDIHFNKNSGDVYDLDSDLRNELIRDIQYHARENLISVKGILVCGDIAFSGKSQEYKAASDFLREVCSKLEIAEEAVFCVPGNHDVDQSIPSESPIIKAIQDQISQVETRNEIDSILTKFSRDSQYNDLLYAPIECYNNEFAGKFKCFITPQKPTWEFDFELDEKYKLRLFGMNSTVISNADDHAPYFKGNRPMLMGQYQVPSRIDKAIHLTLCHHPPECWLDPDQYLKSRMDSRVQIQLYGHKHVQTIQKTDTTLIIGSGATHPSRREPSWIPRYNWISLEVITRSDTDYVSVKVFPRVLNDVGDCFVTDNVLCEDKLYVEYQIPLNVKSCDRVNLLDECKDASSELAEDCIDSKSLTYEFLSLAYVNRDMILSRLALRREEDEGVKHVKIIDDILERAKKQGCVEQLWQEIQNYKD